MVLVHFSVCAVLWNILSGGGEKGQNSSLFHVSPYLLLRIESSLKRMGSNLPNSKKTKKWLTVLPCFNHFEGVPDLSIMFGWARQRIPNFWWNLSFTDCSLQCVNRTLCVLKCSTHRLPSPNFSLHHPRKASPGSLWTLRNPQLLEQSLAYSGLLINEDGISPGR